MKRTSTTVDDILEPCVRCRPILRTVQARCEELTDQLHKAEEEAEVWKAKYKLFEDEAGFRYVPSHHYHNSYNTTNIYLNILDGRM